MLYKSAAMIESWDGQHFDDWSGSTAGFSFITSGIEHGRAAIESDATSSATVITAGSAVPQPAWGDVFRYTIHPVDGSEVCYFKFMKADSNNLYYIVNDPNNGSIAIRDVDGGADSSLDSTAVTWSAGTWYIMDIDLTDTTNNTIAIELFDDSGTSQGTASGTDSSPHSQDKIEIEHNGTAGTSQSRWDRIWFTNL